MAVGCSSPYMVIQHGSTRCPFRKVFMLHNNGTPAHKPLRIQIKSSTTSNKVFEDQSRGIVCYRDDSGEIVCEGLDEGPRFYPQAPKPAFHISSEKLGGGSSIISCEASFNLFKAMMGGLHRADKGVIVKEGF